MYIVFQVEIILKTVSRLLCINSNCILEWKKSSKNILDFLYTYEMIQFMIINLFEIQKHRENSECVFNVRFAQKRHLAFLTMESIWTSY